LDDLSELHAELESEQAYLDLRAVRRRQRVPAAPVDIVVVVEPAAILTASPRGVNDLYVALTRPTQRLVVVYARDLPPGMAGCLVVEADGAHEDA